MRFTRQEQAIPQIYTMDQDDYEWILGDADSAQVSQQMIPIVTMIGCAMFYLGICVGFCICYFKNRKQVSSQVKNNVSSSDPKFDYDMQNQNDISSAFETPMKKPGDKMKGSKQQNVADQKNIHDRQASKK